LNGESNPRPIRWGPPPDRGRPLGAHEPAITLSTYTPHTLPAQADVLTDAVEAALFGRAKR